MSIAAGIACAAATAVTETVRQNTRNSDIHAVDDKLPRRCMFLYFWELARCKRSKHREECNMANRRLRPGCE
jgi:hypothetical protein